MINTLHVSRYVHVGSTGGTERYLLDLAIALRTAGDNVIMAWIGAPAEYSCAFIDNYGFQVIPLKAPDGYVDEPCRSLKDSFRLWLDDNQPDVIHFHTFSLSEAAMAEVAQSLNIPYVFVYHSPAWSCRRGDLLRWGHTICDGEIRPWRCSSCLMQQRLKWPIIPSMTATALIAPCGLLGRFAGGKVRRRTAYLLDTKKMRVAYRSFLGHAAQTIACAEWSIPVLKQNGALAEKIYHCPQGVSVNAIKTIAEAASVGANSQKTTRQSTTFHVGYVGRITPVKGLHILVEAFANTTYSEARLHVYGMGNTESEAAYQARLRKLAGNDSRISFFDKLRFDEMIEVYRSLDLLAIPSIWLETGPLTLLEALAFGVMPWGSDRIGQLDALKHYGRVIAPNTTTSWQIALNEAFKQHRTRTWQQMKPTAVRTMKDVASEMHNIYEDCLKHGRASPYDKTQAFGDKRVLDTRR